MFWREKQRSSRRTIHHTPLLWYEPYGTVPIYQKPYQTVRYHYQTEPYLTIRTIPFYDTTTYRFFFCIFTTMTKIVSKAATNNKNGKYGIRLGTALISFSALLTLFWMNSLPAMEFQVDYSLLQDFHSSNTTTEITPSAFTVKNQTQASSPNHVAETNVILKDDLLNLRPTVGVEQVWRSLLSEGKQLQHVGVAMEVGVHSAKSCVEAALAGIEVHCFEPSPTSFRRIEQAVKKLQPAIQSRIQLYNVAAGDRAGTVDFTGGGGTGDHVGQFDVWNMEPGRATDKELAKKQGETIQIPSLPLDDVVQKINQSVFMIKVDTQGFEPSVLAGLKQALQSNKIKFLLMEYWPAGMDMMSGKPARTCVAANVLKMLASYGYTLYALPVTSHPRAPAAARAGLAKNAFRETLPLTDVDANCQWYFDYADKHKSDEYKMGYWADVVAVAPETGIDSPITETGKILSGRKTTSES